MFASEKFSLGECDVCGFTRPLKTLKFLTIRMKRTNLRACPDCWTVDHPQYKLGTFKVFDPQALQNPRPARNDDRTLVPTAPFLDALPAAVVGYAKVGVAVVGRSL